MKTYRQKEFVRNLCATVMVSILDDIDEGKTPESWDGHELRDLIADRFARQRSVTMMKGKRRKDFVNHCLTHNL